MPWESRLESTGVFCVASLNAGESGPSAPKLTRAASEPVAMTEPVPVVSPVRLLSVLPVGSLSSSTSPETVPETMVGPSSSKRILPEMSAESDTGSPSPSVAVTVAKTLPLLIATYSSMSPPKSALPCSSETY
ncbi:hypothetical protein ES703_120562 [subsurface metagenome]